MLKRCDFRCVLKIENVRDRHRSNGRLFQARGLATAKARSSMVELQPWMQDVVDHVSLHLTAAGSTRTDTVVLLRSDQCTRIQSLNWMRSGTCIQCCCYVTSETGVQKSTIY